MRRALVNFTMTPRVISKVPGSSSHEYVHIAPLYRILAYDEVEMPRLNPFMKAICM